MSDPINRKKLFDRVLSIEASFQVLAKEFQEIKKELGEPPPRKSQRTNENEVRIQRILINRQRARAKYYSK